MTSGQNGIGVQRRQERRRVGREQMGVRQGEEEGDPKPSMESGDGEGEVGTRCGKKQGRCRQTETDPEKTSDSNEDSEQWIMKEKRERHRVVVR